MYFLKIKTFYFICQLKLTFEFSTRCSLTQLQQIRSSTICLKANDCILDEVTEPQF